MSSVNMDLEDKLSVNLLHIQMDISQTDRSRLAKGSYLAKRGGGMYSENRTPCLSWQLSTRKRGS